jgi:hypothetical protein
VTTLEGPLSALAGDWIVNGTAGELWPVREDIFARTYEPAETVPFSPIGYQGPAQHTYTRSCDGFHEPGICPAASS